MTKVKTRNWSLEKFTASVRATCKRRKLKPIPAIKIKKAYDDGLAVRHAVASLAGAANAK